MVKEVKAKFPYMERYKFNVETGEMTFVDEINEIKYLEHKINSARVLTSDEISVYDGKKGVFWLNLSDFFTISSFFIDRIEDKETAEAYSAMVMKIFNKRLE